MRIICIGDSITYGQNVRADDAWPAVLARYTGNDIRNEGVCGDTTRLGLERFPKAVQLHDPTYVVIQFGHNDCNIWETDKGVPRVSVSAYVANVREMCMRAMACGAVPIVLLPHDAPQKERDYQTRLREYQQELTTALLPMKPPEIDILDDGYGLHPTPTMHAAYAEQVALVCP